MYIPSNTKFYYSWFFYDENFSVPQSQCQNSSGELGDVGDDGRLRCLHGKVHTTISCMCTCSVGSAQCSGCVVYGPGVMAAICTLGFCSFMGCTIFIFSDACPRANCTSKQSCLQNIYMLLYNLSWIPIIMQRFTPVSCFVFEVHLLKLNNDEPN